ncbi:MAG: DNA/RNA non-specific endonuclease, partial [Gemmatimonadetes bacterium]|nr:DNA/RNA non-specific endonuclease [Gemmatimonadota bacterium]
MTLRLARKPVLPLLGLVLALAAPAAAAAQTSSASVLRGDVDGDGRVTAADARRLVSALTTPGGAASLDPARADVNGDGRVTAVDAAIIAQYAAGRDVSRFGVGRPAPGSTLPKGALAQVTCDVVRSTRTVRCGTLAPGAARGDAILGGQGVYVKLASSNVAYDSVTQKFTFDVTLQNLIAQAFGVDTDGSPAAYAARVFFTDAPQTTQGSGEVTVDGDGVDVFTSTNQAYFQYPGSIAPGATSAGKRWSLGVPSTVEHFTFQVYVAAAVRYPQGYVDVYPGSVLLNTAGATASLADSVRSVVGAAMAGAPVTWSSANTAVATVDPSTGVVTAVGSGTTTITATSANPVRTGTATVTVGSPASLAKTGDGQTASVDGNTPVAPAVTVRDGLNALMTGVPVRFRVTAGGGKVNGDTAVTVNTDSTGVARLASWTMGSTAGADSITATAGTATASFGATALDVVINEIMANPAGVADADAEYVELWNRGPAAVNLNGFQVQDNSPARETIGSDVIIPANGFVILGRNTNTSLNGGITVDYVSASVNLANAGDRFRIWAPNGVLLDSVAYGAQSALSGVARERRVGVPRSPDVDGTGWQNPSTLYDVADNNRGTPRAANSPYVAPGPPATVTVSPAFVMIHPADSLQYTAQAKDASGNIATTTFTWSTDNAAVATVTSTGMVHAVADGEVNIIATADNNVQGSVSLQVFTESASAIYRNHLEFGKPLDSDPSGDTIVTKPQYVLSYSAQRGGPNWVSWDLNRTQYGYVPRCNCFSPDSTTDIPAGVYRVNTNDYTGSGYTRGHMVRSEDRTLTAEDNRSTYKMTNILPQTSDLNAGPWGELEFWEESQAKYNNKELYVIAGGIYPASPQTLNNAGKVQIPSYTWKIVVVMNYGQGLADVHSASDLQVIAVKMPNITGISSHHWQEYQVTVDQLEQETGYDFLSLLPDDVEAIVENGGVAPVATATSLSVVTQPADSAVSGVTLTRQPVIQVLDQHGDPFAQSGIQVTAAIATGGGTLDGTATATTDANGKATFTDLGISGAAGDRTLTFTSGSLTAATSTTVHVAGAAAVASQIGMVTQPSASAQSGVAFAQQPVVQIEDGAGTPVAQAGVAVTASIASGGGTLNGTVTVNTDASGTATFTDLGITGTAGARILTFTAPGLTAATSDSIVVTVPTPASTSAQIAAIRAATDGAVSLPVEAALVTYTKPTIGTDAAGFFIQSEANGPALFVQVDPTTLGTGVAAGDKVSFTATSKATLNGLVEVTTLSNFSTQNHGNNVASLVVPVDTVVNLPGQIGTYESRYISITGTLAAAPAAAGTGFVSAQMNTTGTSGNNLLKFRTSTTLASQYDLAANCVISATAPMWRFTTQAQPHAWAASDFTSVSCPAPKVLSVTTSSATQVTVTFDRTIDPATVLANGSQFTANNGLAVSAASVSGKTVVLTTSSQVGGTSYTVTVAGTVKDTQGKAVDPAANSGTFNGYEVQAVLRISEIAPNVASSRDIVEFQVVSGGTTRGMTFFDATGNLGFGTFPTVTVATGDIIVLHLNPDKVTAGFDAPGSETTSKNQYAAASYSSNYDNA